MWDHGKQTVSERDKLNNERMKTITRKKTLDEKNWECNENMGVQMETLNEYKVNDMGTENNGSADFIHYIYFYLLIHFVFFIYFLFIYFYLFLNPPEAICHCALREARGSRFLIFIYLFFHIYVCTHVYTWTNLQLHTRTYILARRTAHTLENYVYVHIRGRWTHMHILSCAYTHSYTQTHIHSENTWI